MRDDIPSEILDNIAIYLEQRDRYACLCVCRSWNTILTPTLYSSVELRSIGRFQQFITTLRSVEASNPLGKFVRKVKLPNSLEDQDLSALSRLCPFVIELDAWYALEMESLVVLQEWKHLTKVSTVIISKSIPNFPLDFFAKKIRTLCIIIRDLPEWIKLTAELPCVEDLELDGRYPSAAISLPDLEAVHRALPCLSALTIENCLFSGEIPEDVAPCDTVRKLTIRSCNGRMWGRYFARKYTNLDELYHVGSDDSDIFGQGAIAEATTEAKILARSCRDLKLFRADAASIYRECLEILREIGAPLIRVEYLGTPGYAASIRTFYATLSDVSLRTEEKMTTEEILEPLKACPALTKLELLYLNSDLALDDCLSCCKSLKNLHIDGNKIYLTRNSTMGDKHHLRQLYIDGYDIADEVFPYLLQHCPLLSDLDCTYGTRHNQSCEIYFPSRSLKKLQIYYHNSCLFKVTQVGKSEQHSELGQIYHESDEGEVDDRTRWYQLLYNYNQRLWDWYAWEINKRSGQQCKNNDKYGMEELERSDEDPKPLSDTNRTPIISITCYSLDIVRLQSQALASIAALDK
ncbi:hypothetical protein DFQ28_007746 [Apophysomyces sp. BC1034]|nr:hypothetical protein DFQ30_007628 [Apophysomyces sp. BC1015]KAG0176077.1 hypothetical protein DFQ29_006597 [Apophysomyces sp. BC1021]KAG0186457.1 hypothetical protein DFQ28_007746 [Apophysomyces sp. BC1034]